MLTIHKSRALEPRPRVIVKRECQRIDGGWSYSVETYHSPLVRVYPKTGKDVALIRMLQHGRDYFAPGEGGGLLVNPKFLTATAVEQDLRL